MSFATALAYWSGLAFVAPGPPPATVIGTALVLHVCDAILCRIFAGNAGRSRNAWTVIGFVGGIWAVAFLLLLPRPAPAPPPPQPARPRD
ncbi:MAG TPA: hypothetical protein VNO26_14545 [Candidatus Limnocylindria bacterium]|nr:hypothetical protein [Candidatus Limnocylindria bacterium]